MTALQKRILGSVLSAAFAAGVAFLAPAYREAAFEVFGLVMVALHIPRPGDVSPADHSRAVSAAVTEALSDLEVH